MTVSSAASVRHHRNGRTNLQARAASLVTRCHVIPLFTILVAQLVALILLAYFVSFRMMGRDYDSAAHVLGSGMRNDLTTRALYVLPYCQQATTRRPRRVLSYPRPRYFRRMMTVLQRAASHRFR